MSSFSKKQKIGEYIVEWLVEKGETTELYHVKNDEGKNYFLKLFIANDSQNTAAGKNDFTKEKKIWRQISHPNLCRYRAEGVVNSKGENKKYIVFDFVSGEPLSHQLARKQQYSIFDATQLILGVLNGLKHLHSLNPPVLHRGLTPDAIMLSLLGQVPVPKIVDLSYAGVADKELQVYKADKRNPAYMATEIFSGLFTPQSDLYAVGVIFYQLLTGDLPWEIETESGQEREKIYDKLYFRRQKNINIPISDIFQPNDQLIHILRKALHEEREYRFQSAEEFIHALHGEIQVEKVPDVHVRNTTSDEEEQEHKPLYGFAAIAGMEELKEQLYAEVIDVLRNPEEYKRHHLGLPNGLLLYGPPGCGKTFFATRFAEETGYHFIKVMTSDIASIYIHGTQEKIKEIFDEARRKSPTILYFDEINSMVPKRDSAQEHAKGEVNEFLSQLDNCGSTGIFVVASTNYPDQIDSAVLRAGRLEQKYYLSPPDPEARKALFRLYLKNRPLDYVIDYRKLAELTENYVSADIKLVIDKASRKTIREKRGKITMKTLLEVITDYKPTVSLAEIRRNEKIRDKFENDRI